MVHLVTTRAITSITAVIKGALGILACSPTFATAEQQELPTTATQHSALNRGALAAVGPQVQARERAAAPARPGWWHGIAPAQVGIAWPAHVFAQLEVARCYSARWCALAPLLAAQASNTFQISCIFMRSW